MKKLLSLIMVIAMIITSTLTCFAEESSQNLSAYNGDKISIVSATENMNEDGSVTRNIVYSINGGLTHHIVTTFADGSSIISIDGKDELTINIASNGFATSDDELFNNKYLFNTDKQLESRNSDVSVLNSNWRYLYYEAKSLDLDNIISSAVISGVTGDLVTIGASIMIATFSPKFKLGRNGAIVTKVMGIFLSAVACYYAAGTYTDCTIYVYEFVSDTNIRKAEISLYYKGRLITNEEDVYNVEGWD